MGGICVDMSGMDKILEIHGAWGISLSLFTLTIPTRGGFGPRLSGRSSVDGYQRNVERKRLVQVILSAPEAKIRYPGIPLFFPVGIW